MSSNGYMISVITATWNVESTIQVLIDSLRAQTDKNFEWIVVDGASTDNTLNILQSVHDLNILISSQEDFGIYDALNRGVQLSNGQYYLVLGADDELFPNAISDFRRALNIYPNSDLIAGAIQTSKGIQRVKRGPSWLNAQYAYVTQHAVGLLIKKELHTRCGLYSRKFPIAADQLFIMRAMKSGASVKEIEVVVGRFSTGGVSGVDKLGTITESFRVQLLVGENKYLAFMVFILRLLKNFSRL